MQQTACPFALYGAAMSHTAAPANSNTSPRAIWSLTWPQMLMMYVQFFSGFTTVWTAGQISADLQAALGMITQCGIFFMVLCMALSSGGMAAVSQSFGAGLMDRARRYVAASIGGTALLIQLAEMGIILSASRDIPAWRS